MDSKKNQPTRDIEEIFTKLKDPVEQERQRIRRNREKKLKEIKEELAL